MNKLELDLISLEETLERWFLELDFRKALKEKDFEIIPISESLNRVTAEAVIAAHSSPNYYAASVDGVTVLSSKTFGVNEHNPFTLRIGRDAKFIATGNLMPKDADAVVPIDSVKFLSINEVQISKFCAPWENVRPVGEEFNDKEVIIPAHHKIRPLDIAAMLMGGISNVKVIKKPIVGILPIGTSLVPAGTSPQSGKMVEISSHILSNMLYQVGSEPVVFDIVPEVGEDLLRTCFNIIMDIDFLIIVGGPSADTRPIAEFLKKAGELVAYGVLVKPGMTTCFGAFENTPVIGLPRHAMATLIIFEYFCLPVINSKLGTRQERHTTMKAYLSQDINSPKGVDEFIRVCLAEVDKLPVATPLSRGSNILMSLVRSDGVVRVNPETSKIKAGDVVDIHLLRPENNISKKILISGTYDICFDILRNELQTKYDDMSLFSSNVGSMRGLMAIKAGYCHMSSIHLFDDETGEYNIPFVKKFLYDVPLLLINIFHRRLGLIVPKGNPKNIRGFDDLTREDVTLINRIRGSGTRMVFDYYLKKMKVEINKIRGYSKEAHTHLNLASAIASGNADTGLGILEAARATGLDFVPLIPEQMDLVVPKKFLQSYPVRCFLKVVASDDFKRQIELLGGYNTTHTGKVIYEK